MQTLQHVRMPALDKYVDQSRYEHFNKYFTMQHPRKRRRLEWALYYWLEMFPDGFAIFGTVRFEDAMSLFTDDFLKQFPSRQLRKGVVSALLEMNELTVESSAVNDASRSTWKRRLFDLSIPVEAMWGLQNRQLASAPYFLTDLPLHVREVLTPFLTWKDVDRGSGLLTVEALDERQTTLVSERAWTRRPNQTVEQPTGSETYFLETIRAALGFARLQVDSDNLYLRGLGIPEDTLRLSHIIVGDNFSAFLRFLVARRGYATGNVRNVIVHWMMLMHKEHGFFRHAQRLFYEDLAAVLRDNVPRTVEAWHAWCDEQVRIVGVTATLLNRTRIARSRHRQGRSAYTRLSVLLSSERPLDQIVWPTVLHLLDHDPGPNVTALERTEHIRRAFTIAALTAIPLRVNNWSRLRWGKNLALKNGRWHIYIGREEFKNRRALDRDYDHFLNDYAQNVFHLYYKCWIAHFGYDPLSAGHVDRISFVMAEFGKPPNKILHERTISQRLHFLGTLWNLKIGPHAFRHIVATDWLKRYPNDFVTVAGLLHETEATVKKAYAHLASADHAQRSNREHEGLETRARHHLNQTRNIVT